MTAIEELQAFLKEKNIAITLQKQKIRYVEDGSLIIDEPQVIVEYVKQTAKTVAGTPSK